MRKLIDGVHSWSVFSEQKQLDFNGFHLAVAEGPALVDPPALSDADARDLAALERPKLIIVTNKDHRRAAPAIRERLDIPLWVHEADRALMDCEVDGSFTDGQVLGGELHVVHLPDGKSPGECALYWPARRVVILGDALIGRPPGMLSMLPPDKFADPTRARAGLQRLAELDVESVLVGDGTHILHAGAAALGAFFSQA